MSPIIASLLLFASAIATLGIPTADPFDPSLYSFSFVVLAVYGGLITQLRSNFRKAILIGVLMLVLPAFMLFVWDTFFLQRTDIGKSNFVYLAISAGLSFFYLISLYVLKDEFGDKRNSVTKDLLVIAPFLILPVILANVLVLWFWSIHVRPVYSVIPKDAIFIIESSDPINDWKAFSQTKVWRHMKQNPTYAYISETADWLDELITANESVLGVLKKKQLIISAHMIAGPSYDFLYTMDLGEGAKISYYMDGVNGLMGRMGYSINKSRENGQDFHSFGDETGMLFVTFKDNMMLASYSKELLNRAIKQAETPYFTDNAGFKQVSKNTGMKGQCRFWVNHKEMLPYLKLYMADVSGMPTTMSEILDFTGLDVNITDENAQLAGYSLISDSSYSLLGSLRQMSGSSIHCHEVMPDNMSFFTRIGFNDFKTFYGFVMEDLKKDSASYNDFMSIKRRVERLSKISLEEDLLGWVGDEIAVGMMPLDEHGQRQAYVGFFRAQDSTLAQEKMDFVQKRMKKGGLIPIKFKEEYYRGYIVNYMEMKGIFKLFFGKLFRKFDKPQYMHIGEYVVFSNDTIALHRIADHYIEGRTLSKNEAYNTFSAHFKETSNYYIYIDNLDLFPWLPTLGTAETQIGMRRNRKYITCFPQGGFQMIANHPGYNTDFFVEFKTP